MSLKYPVDEMREEEQVQGTRRIAGLDFLRGALLLSVIAGHIILGSFFAKAPDKNLARFVIYSIHMPLFLSLSGYLLTRESICSLTFPSLIKKYFFRLLLPWCLVFPFFFVPRMWLLSEEFRLRLLVRWLLYPMYHLWYGTALFGMIIGLFFLLKTKIRLGPVLLLSLLFTWLYLTGFYGDNLPKGNILITLLGHKRMYYYFSFFLIGFYIRNSAKLSLSTWQLVLGISVFGVLRLWHYFYPFEPLQCALVFTCLNIFIIPLCLRIFSRLQRLPNITKPVVWIGKNSLPIYLWHPFITWIVGQQILLPKTNGYVYYAFTLVAIFMIFLPLIYFLSSHSFVNKYIFGNHTLRN
jgi:fucose 4-O-acetylase-like acetyltransferase